MNANRFKKITGTGNLIMIGVVAVSGVNSLFEVKLCHQAIVYNKISKQFRDKAEIKASVLFHPDSKQLVTIHKNLGKFHCEALIPSIVEDTLRDVVSQYSRVQLATNRQKVFKEFVQKLKERALEHQIALVRASVDGCECIEAC